MTPKDDLYRRIQMYGFALDEITIYLDTHPNCKDGMAYYHKYKRLEKEAKDEYNRLYGALTACDVNDKDKWKWVCEPFPWEGSDK